MAPDLNVPDLAKVTLGDASRATPALAVLGNKLVLAWTGTDSPGHLNVMTSTDGYYFGGKVTLPELSIDGPALAAGGNRLFVAWTGTDSQHRLNVTSSIDGLAFPPANKVTLPDTAMFGPALAFMNGRVYLAWVGTDRRLNVTSSTDGLAFPSANKVTLDEQSDSQVGLCAANGTLYLVWQGTDSNSSINFRQSTDGRNWSNKITLRESSDCAPAVVQGHELVLAWTGRDARHALNRMHSPSGPQGLGDKLSLDDAATAGVALAGFQGKFFIAWAGTDRQHRLNVMVLMPDDPAAALLDQILQAYPQVGQAIQWQMTPGSPSNAYAPPTPANMVAYANWSPLQKADLLNAFRLVLQWVLQGAPSVQPNCDGLTDAPPNVNPNISQDTVTVLESVTQDYMWKLYVNHVAFSLVHMANGVHTGGFSGGFSLADLAADRLRWLLSSETMAWNIMGQYYGMGTYAARVPALRANNLASTPFAPPRWVYSWLRDNQLVGQTRKDTICRVLDWMRHNMVHFYGASTFGNCQAIWQYRGYPPLSRIVAGTIDANNPAQGTQHWTMGCHGSVGFLNAVLRAVNIPVLPVWACGHELAYFPTEGLYLDHGDDPYNQNVKNSSKPISLVFIDEATYATRFSPDPTVNVTGPAAACANVGMAAQTFPQ